MQYILWVHHMDFKELVGKVIADRNSRKLGLCIDIQKSLIAGDNGDVPLITMIMKVERILRDPIKVEVEVKRVLKIDGIYAWIDTTKKQFSETIKNAKRVKKGKDINKKPDLATLKNYRPPPSQRL